MNGFMNMDGNMNRRRRATANNMWHYNWRWESLGYLKRMNETADNTRYGIYVMGSIKGV
jgi:hypothetical protein